MMLFAEAPRRFHEQVVAASVAAPAILLLLLLLPPAAPLLGQEMIRHQLQSSDGVSVPAWWIGDAASSGDPVIALFHQGGSSGRAEYGPIVPILRDAGYTLLLIDQRRGGTLFDGENELSPGFDAEVTSYCDARADIEAALDFALERAPGPVVLWGSSYSAALVIRVAADRPNDVAGVVALSPASGDSMSGCRPDDLAGGLEPPLLVGRPAAEMEIESVAAQLARFEAAGDRTFVADPGSHGSSMLVEERVGADVSRSWSIVLDFLASLR